MRMCVFEAEMWPTVSCFCLSLDGTFVPTTPSDLRLSLPINGSSGGILVTSQTLKGQKEKTGRKETEKEQKMRNIHETGVIRKKFI